MEGDSNLVFFLLGYSVLAAWLVLIFRGDRFWRAVERLPDPVAWLPVWPSVVAVVPARNESEVVGAAVESLLRQRYPGQFHVVLVDDGSDDGTVEVARAATRMTEASERLEVIAGRPLPPGWSGKLWAVAQGIDVAEAVMPGAAYFLLTDADIVHDADNLARLVAKAECENRDLVSLMVLLRCRSFWERLLIPAFVFFFQKLYPFPWVNRDDKSTAAAAGGCMLVRRDALSLVGGIASIRDCLIDDCALARAIKARGGGLWLGLTTQVHSLRTYDRLADIWNMVVRSAFVQLGHSWMAVVGTAIAMIFLYLGPPATAIAGIIGGDVGIAGLGCLAWMLMATAYRPTLGLYGLGAWRGLALPLVATLFAAMTVDSAIRHARGRGGAWKGRSYSAAR